MSQTFPAPVTLLADTVHFKEFYGGYNGTCGETALTAALICAERLGNGAETHDAAVALMLSVTAEMRAAGWADANGASTLWSLAQDAAKKRGAQIALEWDYAEPFPHDWHSILLANAGIKPIVLQVGAAHNLVGQDGTGNDEAGVDYHFICIVGKCADGYIAMDGDNWQIENELAIYSYATLGTADICGLLMLDVVSPPPPPPPPAPKYPENPPRPALTFTAAYGLAVQADFSTTGTPSPAQIITAIADAESGLHPDATNTAGNTPPSTDRGIIQINSYFHSEVPDSVAFDPASAFKAAYTISKNGTDFSPWTTYTSGAYKQYLQEGPMNSTFFKQNADGSFTCIQTGFLVQRIPQLLRGQ